MSDILKNLNKAQHAAVVNFEHPSLIVAGAGSGKTRVLTCRIAYMLSRGVDPSSILALTFTNKAAKEMRERIGRMVDPAQARRLWMGTFHSVFARILRAEAAALGFPATFTIYDTADSRNLVRRIIKDMNLPDDTYKPAEVLSRISLAKNNLVTPGAYEANTNLIAEDRQNKKPEIVNIYKEYARKCREFGAMDFDDLLLNINILFRDHPEITAKYQQMFKYILVDEYQDTNYAQYIIIRRLAQGHGRVCVVGDDAQSIYSFRGAKIENILRFPSDFP
ncbi:MAG: UvrD-helicase domain-containing protein, partial [Rikenellaceae bacterium]|nr:UvrD-helicase domain-containing protein [Rikenellaceae bacterium]